MGKKPSTMVESGSNRASKSRERVFEERISTIQERVLGKMAGDTPLEEVYRHFSSIEIDTNAMEVEWTSTFPDQASAHGVGNVHWTRSFDYDGAGRLEKACERIVRELERAARHVDTVNIDLDEDELTIECGFPDLWGTADEEDDEIDEDEEEDVVKITRTLSLESKRWSFLRKDIKKLVAELHEHMLKPDEDYDADRCMRCKHSDCCYDWRIHMTEAERQRIVEHLGEPDDATTYAKYFEHDDDLSGFYRSVFRHVGDPAPGKEDESDGHCSFLKPGPDGRPCCSIYEVRPRVCREFDAGYCTEWTKLLPPAK